MKRPREDRSTGGHLRDPERIEALGNEALAGIERVSFRFTFADGSEAELINSQALQPPTLEPGEKADLDFKLALHAENGMAKQFYDAVRSVQKYEARVEFRDGTSLWVPASAITWGR